MKLKLFINILTLMVLYSSSTFAFDLSSNHYGAFGQLIKGKQTYKPSQVFPFSEALQINATHESVFYTEKLPSILTEDISKFYFYAKKFDINTTSIYINDVLIDNQYITITNFIQNADTIQLLEFITSNEVITADQASKVKITSNSNQSFWIYQVHISNHFNIFPTHRVYNKDGVNYRQFALFSHCNEDINNIRIELPNNTLNFNFKKGFQQQIFELPLEHQSMTYNAEIFVKGLLFGKEEINVPSLKENNIHIIPIISPSHLSHYSSEIPFELQTNKPMDVSDLKGDIFSRQINYSIHSNSEHYDKEIGFLQERSIFKYSTIHFDSPYPSRDELNKMIDLNIKTLGYFQREKYGYPVNYFTQKNMAYLYQEADRNLLVYKQYNSIKYNGINNLNDALIFHEYQLSLIDFPFQQSLIFVFVNSTKDLIAINQYINTKNRTFQSPQLSINNFNQFGKLFLNRNRTKLDYKVKIESPFKLDYSPSTVVKKNTWAPILSNELPELHKDLQLEVFNPNSTHFSGITSFKHQSNKLTYAEWTDGTIIKLQQYKPNHYFILLPSIKPFEIKFIKLFENNLTSNKHKPLFLSMNKRNGIIHWQYKGNKLTRKKENLFIPIFNQGISHTPIKNSNGKLIQKGSVFTEYSKSLTTDNDNQIKINTYVFNDLPYVKYNFEIEIDNISSSHLFFNTLEPPTQYSIDRVYKEEFGYSRFGNHNSIESNHSIFLINKTKVLLSSPQNLNWEYNTMTYNTNEVGFIERNTYPTRFNLLLAGQLNKDLKSSTAEPMHYELDVRLAGENDDIELPKKHPIFLKIKREYKSESKLFNIENSKIEVVNIYPTEKDSEFILELKNSSDSPENTTFTPRRKKSTVYYCLFSGKKTGIVKSKIEFKPKELKTIRFRL